MLEKVFSSLGKLFLLKGEQKQFYSRATPVIDSFINDISPKLTHSIKLLRRTLKINLCHKFTILNHQKRCR